MSATISIVQNYGTSYSGYSGEVGKLIFYFLPVDSGILNKNTNPIRRPSAGTDYSYEVWLRCRCDVAPTLKCFNFKVWYASGLPASGFGITVNSDEVSTYVQPVDSPSAAGTRVDFTTKNSEENSIDLTGTLEDIGEYTSYVIFQLAVESIAELGDFSTAFFIQYDEV